MMRGWYAIACGDRTKIVHVDERGTDTVRGEVPAGSSIGVLLDFVFDTGEVQDGDLLVLTDGSQIRLSARSRGVLQ